MKNTFIRTIIFTFLLFSSCTNSKDMSKKTNDTSKEQPFSPEVGEQGLPTHQASPMSLPQDSMPNNLPADKVRSIPIGTPVSADEMQRLKKDSSKVKKKKSLPKAPDNNQ